METFKTPAGKEIKLYNDGYNLRAKFVGGGELPAELAGIWTSFPEAKNSINIYLARLETKKDTKRYAK